MLCQFTESNSLDHFCSVRDSSRSVCHKTSVQSQITGDKSYSLLPSSKMRSLCNFYSVSGLLISALLSQCTRGSILFRSVGKAYNLMLFCVRVLYSP